MHDNPRGFSTEAAMEGVRAQIEAVWSLRSEGRFVGVDGISIAHVLVEPPDRKDRAVVLVPGRTEFIDKYMETVFDLYQQGYASYVIDHRGQGLSGRMLSDSHKGHVEDFEHYTEDLRQFVQSVVRPREGCAPVLVGHSMGGAVVARYLQLYPGDVAGAALCSPMMEINTGAPQCVVRVLLECLQALFAGRHKEPPYVPGGVGYEEMVFKRGGRLNTLTSSEIRFDYFNQQYRDNPVVKLGSPTRQWLLQAFENMEQVLADVGLIEVPVAVMTAGADRIVRVGGISAFVALLEQAAKVPVRSLIIEGAQHELLMESDEYRIPAMNFLCDFIESIDRT